MCRGVVEYINTNLLVIGKVQKNYVYEHDIFDPLAAYNNAVFVTTIFFLNPSLLH